MMWRKPVAKIMRVSKDNAFELNAVTEQLNGSREKIVVAERKILNTGTKGST